jgi:hypothetical protein
MVTALLPAAPAAANNAWPHSRGPAEFPALTVAAASTPPQPRADPAPRQPRADPTPRQPRADLGVVAPYKSHIEAYKGNHNSKIAALVGVGGEGSGVPVPAGRPEPSPGRGHGGALPATGSSPVLAVAVGSLFVGIGLSALLVRRPATRPGRRRGTGRHHP